MNAPVIREENGRESLSIAPEALGEAIREIIRPVIESIAAALKNNTEALEKLSGIQAVQNERIEALEKQIRLQTPVTPKQLSYLGDAVKQRARALLDKREISDGKAAQKLGSAIKKSLLMRYGIGHLRELPRHEYNVALSQIGMWNDILMIRDVVNEARERTEHERD